MKMEHKREIDVPHVSMFVVQDEGHELGNPVVTFHGPRNYRIDLITCYIPGGQVIQTTLSFIP